MKYRIVQRVDGKFEIHKRKFFIWKYVNVYSALAEAINDIDWLILRKKDELESVNGKKLKKVIKEFDV